MQIGRQREREEVIGKEREREGGERDSELEREMYRERGE